MKIINLYVVVAFSVQASVTLYTSNLCIGHNYKLMCDEYNFIRIISAKYHSGYDVTTWMIQNCGNKHECSFKIPGEGTYCNNSGALLKLEYDCGPTKTYVPVGSSVMLRCGKGVMDIRMASFGLKDFHCVPTVDRPLACNNYTRLDYVRNLCQGKTSCVLQGNEDLFCSLFNAYPNRYLFFEFTCGPNAPYYPNLPNINCPAACKSLPRINPVESATTGDTSKEAMSSLVTCPFKILLIRSAIYVPISENQPSCPPMDITNILQARCNYKDDCRVSLNRGVLVGDLEPCPQQNKHLVLSYTCSRDWYSSNVCEQSTIIIRCRDLAIFIKKAVYQNGRDITISIKTMCQNKEQCQIVLDGDEPGPNCKTSGKYLKITYYCVPKQLTVCEGDEERVKMECETGLVDIKSAFYGRAEWDTCPGPRPSPSPYYNNVLCFKQSQFHQVSNMCHGKRKCSFNVNKSVFGDPCPEYSKYLQVHYSCTNRTELKPERLLLCTISEDLVEEWGDLCTHFSLRDTVDPETFSVYDEDLLNAAKRLKKQKNLKFLISLEIESIDSEKQFIKQCLTFLRSHSLDGVVINPSFDKDKKRIKLSNFLHLLKMELYTEDYLLGYEYTVTDDTDTWIWQDSREITEKVDLYILTMKHKKPKGKPKIINPLYAPLEEASLSYLVDQAVSYGISREKIVLSLNGIALIYQLKTTPTPNSYFETDLEDWYTENMSVCCVGGTWNKTWKCFWDDNAKMPFATWDKLLISYENHFSIDEKMMLVESRGLQGVAFSPETDSDDGACGGTSYPLLKAIRGYASVLPKNSWKINRHYAAVFEL